LKRSLTRSFTEGTEEEKRGREEDFTQRVQGNKKKRRISHRGHGVSRRTRRKKEEGRIKKEESKPFFTFSLFFLLFRIPSVSSVNLRALRENLLESFLKSLRLRVSA